MPPLENRVRDASAAARASEQEALLYEHDILGWSARQVGLLREGRFDLLDLENIAEEIEALGRSQRSALRSAYRLIAMHLLKLMLQPDRATASWENTINRERGHVADLLDDSPSLRPQRADLLAKAYAAARSDAAFETRIEIRRYPEQPPFSLAQVEDKTFWPPGFPKAATDA